MAACSALLFDAVNELGEEICTPLMVPMPPRAGGRDGLGGTGELCSPQPGAGCEAGRGGTGGVGSFSRPVFGDS